MRPRSRTRLGLAGALVLLCARTRAWAGPPGLKPEMVFPSAREYFDPLLADNTELGYGGRMVYPQGGGRIGEISIGDYVGLFRWKLPRGARLQSDLGGGVLARFNLGSPSNRLQVADFTARAPFDLALGKKSVVRFGYWHTSSHLGDDFIARTGAVVEKRSQDLFKAIYAYSPSSRWRAYGGGSYAMNVVGIRGRGALQAGLEAMSRDFWGGAARLFLAQDLQAWEMVHWNPEYCMRAGIRFGDEKRIAAAKIYAEYYTGHLYFLQFIERKESRWGVGLNFEIGNPVK